MQTSTCPFIKRFLLLHACVVASILTSHLCTAFMGYKLVSCNIPGFEQSMQCIEGSKCCFEYFDGVPKHICHDPKRTCCGATSYDPSTEKCCPGAAGHFYCPKQSTCCQTDILISNPTTRPFLYPTCCEPGFRCDRKRACIGCDNTPASVSSRACWKVNPSRSFTDRALDFVKRNELCRLKAYCNYLPGSGWDKWTVGYGMTNTAAKESGVGVHCGTEITQAQADAALERLGEQAFKKLSKSVKDWQYMTDDMRAVIFDIYHQRPAAVKKHFNRGIETWATVAANIQKDAILNTYAGSRRQKLRVALWQHGVGLGKDIAASSFKPPPCSERGPETVSGGTLNKKGECVGADVRECLKFDKKNKKKCVLKTPGDWQAKCSRK